MSPLDAPLENPPLDTLLDPELPLDDEEEEPPDDEDADSPDTGAPPGLDAGDGSDSRGLTRVYPNPSTTRPFPLGRSERTTPPPSPTSMTLNPPPK